MYPNSEYLSNTCTLYDVVNCNTFHKGQYRELWQMSLRNKWTRLGDLGGQKSTSSYLVLLGPGTHEEDSHSSVPWILAWTSRKQPSLCWVPGNWATLWWVSAGWGIGREKEAEWFLYWDERLVLGRRAVRIELMWITCCHTGPCWCPGLGCCKGSYHGP